MVNLHLDARLAARLDASDVVQETFLDAQKLLPAYLKDPRLAFYVWLRVLTLDRLGKIHRQHLGAQCRTVEREASLPVDASATLANQIAADGPTPSQPMQEDERCARVQRVLRQLSTEDREIILMRHFEEMTNGEVAQVMGLTDSAATMRYGRALLRLKALFNTESA
jgi:RNA polymerase sigma-70 factor (ECF subfamily)